MGVVHQGRDAALGRDVAIKMLGAGEASVPAEELERFAREARAAARLDHPNVVGLIEVGLHQGRPFIVMDYVEGETLEAALRSVRMAPRRIADVLRQLALALDHAHDQGIVHRDVKPQNVLLDARGTPRLADFGLARDLEAGAQLTKTGQVLGTPAYMAPEQASAELGQQGPRTDVYALGAVLYRALTGRPPFEGQTAVMIIKQVLFEDPTPPRRIDPSVPRDLETIALRCLEKEPERRYPTAGEVARELGRWIDGEPIEARPRGRIERAARWVRRHRALAAMGTVLVVVIVAAAAIGGRLFVDASAAAEEVARREAAQRFEDDRLAEESRERRRRTIEILDRCRAGDLADDARFTRRVVELSTVLAGPETVEALVAELDRVTKLLEARTRELYRAGAAPTPDEAASGLQPIPGIDAALDDLFARRPGEAPSATAAALERVENRLLARRAASWLRRFETLLQGWHGGDDGIASVDARCAELSIEALGELGPAGSGGIEALDRYLWRDPLEHRAARAALALGRIGSPESMERAIASLDRFGDGYRRDLLRRLPTESIAALDATDAASHVKRGWVRHYRDDPEAALDDFERAIELDPGLAEAYVGRGAVRGAQRRLEDARADLDRAIELDPGDGGAYRQRATIRERQGDRLGALSDLAQAAQADPGDPAIRIQRARLLVDLDRLADAEVELGHVSAAGLEDGHAHFVRGRLHLAQAQRDGDPALYRAAIASFDRSLELEPRQVGTLLARATAYEAIDRRAEAITDVTSAIELDPNDAKAQLHLGDLRRKLGDAESAVRDLERATALDPENADAWASLGVALLEQGRRPRDGVAALDRAVQLAPRNPFHLGMLGLARYQTGDLPGALAALDEALELRPDEAMTLNHRGLVHAKMGRLDLARADFDGAIARDGLLHLAWINRAKLRARTGDARGSLADATRATELRPRAALGWSTRAKIRQGLGELGAALADFDRAVEVAPNDAIARIDRAAALGLSGRLEEAVAELDRAIEHRPRNATAFFNRAVAKVQLGDSAGALADLERVVELTPGTPMARAARDQIAVLRKKLGRR